MANTERSTTDQSLLQMLVNAENSEETWRTFLRRYEPLIYRWCKKWGLQHADVEDVCAAVVVKLFKELKKYDSAKGRFRPWLKTVVNNTVRNYLRDLPPGDRGSGDSGVQRELENQTASEAAEDLAETLGERFDHDIVQAMAHVKQKVQPHTWEVFWLVAYEGQRPTEVAAQRGMTTNAVYQAVYRVGKLLEEACTRTRDPAGDTP